MHKHPRGIIKDSSKEQDEVVIDKKDIVPASRISLSIRLSGNFEALGWFLSISYNWQIIEDSVGDSVLVATRKGGE